MYYNILSLYHYYDKDGSMYTSYNKRSADKVVHLCSGCLAIPGDEWQLGLRFLHTIVMHQAHEKDLDSKI